MGFQFFKTRKEADAARRDMVAWQTRSIRLNVRQGASWVIECYNTRGTSVKYLRDDGFVR